MRSIMAALQSCSCSSPPPAFFSASALSRNAPSTTTVSPGFRPETTSTSCPRSRPRPTGRISNRPAPLWHEHEPAVADPLQRRGRHGHDLLPLAAGADPARWRTCPASSARPGWAARCGPAPCASRRRPRGRPRPRSLELLPGSAASVTSAAQPCAHADGVALEACATSQRRDRSRDPEQRPRTGSALWPRTAARSSTVPAIGESSVKRGQLAARRLGSDAQGGEGRLGRPQVRFRLGEARPRRAAARRGTRSAPRRARASSRPSGGPAPPAPGRRSAAPAPAPAPRSAARRAAGRGRTRCPGHGQQADDPRRGSALRPRRRPPRSPSARRARSRPRLPAAARRETW